MNEVTLNIPTGTKFTVEVDIQSFETVIKALDELPGKVSRQLANNLEQQVQPQLMQYKMEPKSAGLDTLKSAPKSAGLDTLKSAPKSAPKSVSG